MERKLEEQVRGRANGTCEYCKFPESASTLPHVIDHIIARQHGGATHSDNLALCCGRCNLHKGPNIAGIDPLTGRLTPLFNPRQELWQEHFRYDGPRLVGLTSKGRTRIVVLGLNQPHRMELRLALVSSGKWPTS